MRWKYKFRWKSAFRFENEQIMKTILPDTPRRTNSIWQIMFTLGKYTFQIFVDGSVLLIAMSSVSFSNYSEKTSSTVKLLSR